jgi:hypothetical protein
MTLIFAVSPPETIGPLSSRSSRETTSETRHAKIPAHPGVSPETTSETKPQFVSSSRPLSLLERAERDDGRDAGVERTFQ